MLDHLLQRVMDCLGQAHSVTLATYGPAGLQAGVFPCEARGTHLYLLMPRTSDYLLNLEIQASVVAVTEAWRLDGRARPLPHPEYPPDLALLSASEAGWSELVELCPIRLQIAHLHGWGFQETIDIE